MPRLIRKLTDIIFLLMQPSHMEYVLRNRIYFFIFVGEGVQRMRFVADSMLGKLAKWLRVLGYDTYYRSSYRDLAPLVGEGRRLLSRNRRTVDRFSGAVYIHADRVGDQLMQLREEFGLSTDRSRWFSRCLICGVPLETVRPEQARENIPEYVFYRNMPEVRFCPSCGRYFWPGSHREKMMEQLRRWGFGE